MENDFHSPIQAISHLSFLFFLVKPWLQTICLVLPLCGSYLSLFPSRNTYTSRDSQNSTTSKILAKDILNLKSPSIKCHLITSKTEIEMWVPSLEHPNLPLHWTPIISAVYTTCWHSKMICKMPVQHPSHSGKTLIVSLWELFLPQFQQGKYNFPSIIWPTHSWSFHDKHLNQVFKYFFHTHTGKSIFFSESKQFRMQDQRKSSCLFVCYIFQYSEEPVYNKKEWSWEGQRDKEMEMKINGSIHIPGSRYPWDSSCKLSFP